MLEGLISCLGDKKLEDKHKIKEINSNYNQILVDDKDIPVSLTEFCRLKKVALSSFYKELHLLKRYYNAALCFTLKNNSIEINPLYNFTNLCHLIEKNKLT
jgi:hypothetical protein